MPKANRLVRLFVSSTFVDMHAERDALNRFVFPYLRSLCAQLNVEFVPVDLRWGITQTQAETGKTVEICLREVEDCFPFFVGILGERYGWVYNGEISVTEAEIEVGALRHTPNEVHAVFCFRAPIFTKRQGFPLEEENKEKLEALKSRIRRSGYGAPKEYDTLEALCEHIKTRLEAAIRDEFPPVAELDAYSEEKRAQQFFVDRVARVFTGRNSDLEQLDTYAQQGGTPLLLFGQPGCGKTALLCRWVQCYATRHSESFLFYHFCGTSSKTRGWPFVVRRLLTELSAFADTPMEIPEDDRQLSEALPRMLSICASVPITLVLDEIDILSQDSGIGIAWLPASLPPHVRLIVSSKKAGTAQFTKRGFQLHEVRLLTEEEQDRLVEAYLPDYGKNLEPTAKEALLSSPAAKSPQYLRTLLDELIVFGKNDALSSKLNELLRAKNTTALLVRTIRRLEFDFKSTESDMILSKVLCFLFCSKDGLTETELLALLAVPHLVWSPLYYALQPYLLERDGVLTFWSKTFEEAVRRRYRLWGKLRRETQLSLTKHFEGMVSTRRGTENLAWLYWQTDSADALYDLLTNPEQFALLSGDLTAIKEYWAYLESKPGSTHSRRAGCRRLMQADFSSCPPTALVQFLLESDCYGEAIRLARKALARQEALPEVEKLQLLRLLGAAYHKQGNRKKALAQYERHRQICQRFGDPLELSRITGDMAALEAEDGQLREAVEHYRVAVDICRKYNFFHGIQSGLGNMGLIYTHVGDRKAARTCFAEQERICLETGNLSGQAGALSNLGNLAMQSQHWAQAQRHFAALERVCRRTGDPDVIQRCRGLQGMLLAELTNPKHDLVRAETLFLEQLRISQEIKNFYGEQAALCNLSALKHVAGDTEAARAYCARWIALCDAHGEFRYKIEALQWMETIEKQEETCGGKL